MNSMVNLSFIGKVMSAPNSPLGQKVIMKMLQVKTKSKVAKCNTCMNKQTKQQKRKTFP